MPELTLPLACVVCLRALESAVPSSMGDENQPIGTKFTSPGHWGSMFDPLDSTWLEVNICDECLDDRAGRQVVAIAESVPPPGPRVEKIARRAWDPDA